MQVLIYICYLIHLQNLCSKAILDNFSMILPHVKWAQLYYARIMQWNMYMKHLEQYYVNIS